MAAVVSACERCALPPQPKTCAGAAIKDITANRGARWEFHKKRILAGNLPALRCAGAGDCCLKAATDRVALHAPRILHSKMRGKEYPEGRSRRRTVASLLVFANELAKAGRISKASKGLLKGGLIIVPVPVSANSSAARHIAYASVSYEGGWFTACCWLLVEFVSTACEFKAPCNPRCSSTGEHGRRRFLARIAASLEFEKDLKDAADSMALGRRTSTTSGPFGHAVRTCGSNAQLQLPRHPDESSCTCFALAVRVCLRFVLLALSALFST